MTLHTRSQVILTIASILIVAVGVFAWREYKLRRPPSPVILYQARQGIETNAAWEPVIQKIGGLELVLVPAGCFQMGSSDEQLRQAYESCQRFYGASGCIYDFSRSEQPLREVCFEQPFWIGWTEVTNSQYGAPRYTEREGHYRSPSWPVENISRDQALAFCAEHGLRLPTEAEWEYAARGPDAWIYPWGNSFDQEILTWGQLNPDDVARHPAGASWVGAADMSGGAAEWVDDPETAYGSPAPGGTHMTAIEEDVARGGSWFSFSPFLLRSTYRELFKSGYTSSVIGFRCAIDLLQP